MKAELKEKREIGSKLWTSLEAKNAENHPFSFGAKIWIFKFRDPCIYEAI